MSNEALKLELIQWLSQLENEDTINYLKVVKDSLSKEGEGDWWEELPDKVKSYIEQSELDIENNLLIAHEEVARKCGH